MDIIFLLWKLHNLHLYRRNYQVYKINVNLNK